MTTKEKEIKRLEKELKKRDKELESAKIKLKECKKEIKELKHASKKKVRTITLNEEQERLLSSLSGGIDSLS